VTGAAYTRRIAAFLVVALGTATAALADGPHIALHATQGRYEVTLFSAPDPLVTGPVELTLLVQDANTGALLSDVTAGGALVPASGAAIPLTLTPGGSSNRQLWGETVRIAAPGNYTLHLRVTAGGGPVAEFSGGLPVDANRGKRNTVLWAVFVLLASIGLFLANQTAKQRLRVARRSAG
jgi:hypothetical protein